MNSEVDLTKQCYQIWQKVAKVAKKCYQKWQKVAKVAKKCQKWRKRVLRCSNYTGLAPEGPAPEAPSSGPEGP